MSAGTLPRAKQPRKGRFDASGWLYTDECEVITRYVDSLPLRKRPLLGFDGEIAVLDKRGRRICVLDGKRRAEFVQKAEAYARRRGHKW